MISNKFLRSSFIYSVVGALPYASGVILIPFLTDKLTPEQFGANELYLGIMYLVQLFTSFALDTFTGINYYEHKDDKQKLREFIGTVLLVLLVLGAFVITFLLLTGPSFFKVFLKSETLMEFFPYGALTVFTAFFNGIFKTYSNLLINQQRPERFMWLNFTNFIITIAGTVLLLYIIPSGKILYAPIAGRLIPAFLSAGLSVFLMISEFGFTYKKIYLKSIWAFCAPMLFYFMMNWVINYIDRYIIENFLEDLVLVSIFAIAVKIAMMIDFVQLGLSNAIHPKVFTIWKDNNLSKSTLEVNRYYNGLTALTLLLIPLVNILVPLLVPVFIKKPIYYEAFVYLPILTLGYATRGAYFMFLAPLYFFKKSRVLPKVLFFTAVFQVITGIILIKNFGIMGAVVASVLNKPVQAFFLYLESRKIFTFSFNKTKIIYLPIVFILMVLITEGFATPATRILIASCQMILTTVLVAIAYRKELKPLIGKYLN